MVDQPDSPHLRDGLRGSLLIADRWKPATTLEIRDLRDGRTRRVDLDEPAAAFSGLDAHGRLATLTGTGELRLRFVLEDRETTVPLATNGTADGVELSPTTGRLALSFPLSTRRHDLEVRTEAGELLLEADGLTRAPRWVSDSLLTFATGDGLVILDVDTGGRRLVAAPWKDACLSPTGRRLISYSRLVSFQSNEPRPAPPEARWTEDLVEPRFLDAPIPGLLFDVLGWIDERRVVYEGLPTAGEPQPYNGALLTGPSRMWTVKVADLETGEFATVAPHVGNRFGEVRYCPDFELP